MSEEATFREDGSLVNVLTGLGTGRDKTTATHLKPAYFLTQWDMETLYKAGIPRRYVDDIPEETLRHQTTIALGGDESDEDLIKDFETYLQLQEFQPMYAEVMRLQRLYGGAALLLLIQDGLDPAEPVGTIKTIRGMVPLSRYELHPFNTQVFDLSKPEYYMLSTSKKVDPNQTTNSHNIKIHHTRVIRFDGLYLPWNVRKDNEGWGMSALQLLYEEYKRYESALAGLEAMMTDSDLFVHKLPGLFNKLARGEEGGITRRLELNKLSRSLYGGMLIDAEEEVEFLSRALQNLASATDPFVKALQAATGWPASILMGESPGGLGKEGRFEERVWSSICEKWQETYCRGPVTQLFRYFFAAQDGPTGGTEPDSWRVKFPSVFTQTEAEKAALISTLATAESSYISSGVLNAFEVRMSHYGGTEFNPEITLNEEITAQLEQQVTAQHETTMLNYAMQAEAAMNPEVTPEGEAAPPAPETGKTDAIDEFYENQGFRIAVTHSIKGAKAGRLVYPDGQRVDSSEKAPILVLGTRKPTTRVQRVEFFQNGDVVKGPYVAGFTSKKAITDALEAFYPSRNIIGLVPISASEEDALRIVWDSQQ